MQGLRLVLGDQLSAPQHLSSLRDAVPGRDIVLMAEVAEELRYAPHHRQKIAMVLSAMRQHAAALSAQGFEVVYVRHDQPQAPASLVEAVLSTARQVKPARLIMTRSGEHRLEAAFDRLDLISPVALERREDDRYICSRASFEDWARGRRELRMEFFYRRMREATGILMDGKQPAGGRWNFDAENRKRLPRGVRPPRRLEIAPNPVTRAAIAEVERLSPDGFGDLEPFGWATNATEAEALCEHFFCSILQGFGDYQDAMAAGEPWMWHARLSAALNLGLLDPLDLCRRAEAEWRAGSAPLASVEGFVRQILGWREFVRGIYWLKGPDYGRLNVLGADRRLPDFYWTGKTSMACVAEAVGATRKHAYAHHIQRLMVTGNLAMLLGVHPDEIDAWYLGVYADAYEWVEMPNTRGMATFADGGVVGSKPYAAGGAYINRMSDYCSACPHDPQKRLGPEACPFTTLYWAFLARNEHRLRGNPRLSMPYASLSAMAPEMRAQIETAGERLRLELGALPLPRDAGAPAPVGTEPNLVP